jgi:hypothetical protein
MSLTLATLAALSLASLPDAPLRPELGVALGPGVLLPRGIGLEGKVEYDRFGVGGNLNLVEGASGPLWSAWASARLIGTLRVFGGATTGVGFPSCSSSGPNCPTGPQPADTVPFAGLAIRADVGPSWFELSPSTLFGGPAPPFTPYGLVNAFIAGPPLASLGWQVTPHLSVSLRAGILPLAVAYGF